MRSFRQSRLTWFLVVLLGLGMVVLLSGCDTDDDDIPEHEHEAVLPDHEHEPEMPTPPTVARADVVETNAMIAYHSYKAALKSAQHFKEDLVFFKDDPDAELGHTRESWLAMRETYQPTEIYRFRLGPIDVLADDGTLGEDGDGPEARINGWPLGEAFIDYVYDGATDGDEGPEAPLPADAPSPNIVEDTSVTITVQRLKDFTEFGDDERNLAAGYHAIEFLLWGQDLNFFDIYPADGSIGMFWGAGTDHLSYRDWTPGWRPASDFFHNADLGDCTSGPNPADHEICQRRMTYLEVATDLLIEDLQRVVDAWDPAGTGNYYDTFTATANTDQSVAKILEGMGRMAFGELAGERINIARVTGDQEEEHSCFSDNTHRDIFLNVVGIQNMYLGRFDPLLSYPADYEKHRLGIFTTAYTGAEGGIHGLLMSEGHAALAADLNAAIDKALAAAAEIDGLAKGSKKFDVQILEGEGAIKQIIIELVDVTEAIQRAITALGFEDLITEGGLEQDTEEEIDNVS